MPRTTNVYILRLVAGKYYVGISKNPQKRQAVGDGSTTSMPNRGKESFNFGRGPTKGNQL